MSGIADATISQPSRRTTKQYELGGHHPLGTGVLLSALVPPRPIPNRVVKQRSAKGTGGMTPWETRSMHLRQVRRPPDLKFRRPFSLHFYLSSASISLSSQIIACRLICIGASWAIALGIDDMHATKDREMLRDSRLCAAKSQHQIVTDAAQL